jgi:hypothetical protein
MDGVEDLLLGAPCEPTFSSDGIDGVDDNDDMLLGARCLYK